MVNFQFYKFSKHKCPNSGAFFICGCNTYQGTPGLVSPVLELKLFSKFIYAFISINEL